MTDEPTVEVPETLVKDLADNHKQVARHAYKKSRTSVADQHHSWARQLNEETDRQWSEVAED